MARASLPVSPMAFHDDSVVAPSNRVRMIAAEPCCLTHMRDLARPGRILTLQTLVAIPAGKKETNLVNRLPDERLPRSGVTFDLGTVVLDQLWYQSWFRRSVL